MRNVLFALACLVLSASVRAQKPAVIAEANMQKELAAGWNTWDINSLVNYVHLPEGISLNLSLKQYQDGTIMQNPLTGQQEQHVLLGAHADDGSYSELTIDWQDMQFRVQSATDGDHLILLVTPLKLVAGKKPVLVTAAGLLWQYSGSITKQGDRLQWFAKGRRTDFYASQPSVTDPYVKTDYFYNAYTVNGALGFSTGRPYSLQEIKQIIDRQRKPLMARKEKYDSLATVFEILQSAIAWNTVYEPLHQQVITPVSRRWGAGSGYVLFDWDNYFCSYMAALFNKRLAYANAIAITNEITERGFIPNMATPLMKTRDRSEPPVGSFCVREIYRRYKEKWFLSYVYDKLLSWNRWWATRRDLKGLLVWGSNDYAPLANSYWERRESGVNQRQGASFESGMDNAPMYFDIPFDTTTGLLQIWDVGLNGMYIQDCDALADIARVLNKTDDYKELVARKKKYTDNLSRLWDEKTGIYRNKRVDNGLFSDRISPTCFYALLTDAPDQAKAERMMKEHFFNPNEFYGEWMIPTVPRNDSSFAKQDYWQGRIWGPSNFLVYLGLRKHHLDAAAKVLMDKSKALLLKNWNADHLVCENYNAITGTGGEKDVSSDPFYFWGALLVYMEFIDKGYMAAPEHELP